jgi:GTP-binding protein
MHTAHFLTSAPQLEHLPPVDLPEIAFVGRSNAGKSTASTRSRSRRAWPSHRRRPGRTQHINLFGIGKQKVDDARAGRPARLRLCRGAEGRPSCAGSA